MTVENLTYSEHREALRPSMVGVATAIAVTYATLIAAWGPMGIDETMSFFARLYLTGLAMAADLVTCYGGFLLTLYLMRSRPPWQTVLALVPAALIFAAPCTAVAYTGFHLAKPGRVPLSVLPSTYLFFVLILLSSGAILYYMLHMRVRWLRATGDRVAGYPSAHLHDESADRSAASRRADRAAIVAEQNGPEPPTRFFQRLPGEVGNDVHFLKASGHYVEVVTSAGSAIILMRLTDAVAELDTAGMRIHRSYWAAYEHMTGLQRRDKRIVLCLTGGHELPVSRSLLAAVRNELAARTGLSAGSERYSLRS